MAIKFDFSLWRGKLMQGQFMRWPMVFGLALASPIIALAQVPAASAPMQIQAEVVEGCQIGTANSGSAGTVASLNFGSASGLATGRRTASTGASQVATIRCTPGTNLTMQFGGGQNSSGGQRRLQLGSSGNRIPYRLCRDAACNNQIGINGQFSRAIGSNESQDVRLNIYGDLQLTGSHAAGNYTDIVTITFSW